MARKRLTPVDPAEIGQRDAGPVAASGRFSAPGPVHGPAAPMRPPIAHVAGDAAARAALEEMAGVLRAAETEGRMVVSLPLGDIASDYLIRDRLANDADAMAELRESLRQRGQQTPIEVTDLGSGAVPRYGLISGWRRLVALRGLSQDSDDPRFAQVLALVRQPRSGAEAYVAMVEENEIRADLSFYERARIVLRALEAGAFDSEKKALQGLFSAALPAKRSKIKSFIPIVTGLDAVLRFPARISEKAGLALSKALEADPQLAGLLAETLTAAAPETAEAEQAILRAALRPETGKSWSDTADRDDIPVVEPISDAPMVAVSGAPGRVILSGEGVTDGFIAELRLWLEGRSA